jgi:hypothetical protein
MSAGASLAGGEEIKKKHYANLKTCGAKFPPGERHSRTRAGSQSDLLENRAGDNWQPLLAVPTPPPAAHQEWVIETARAAAQMSKKDVADSGIAATSLNPDRIITERRKEKERQRRVNWRSRRGGTPFLPTTELLTELNKDEEGPWKESQRARKRNSAHTGSQRC